MELEDRLFLELGGIAVLRQIAASETPGSAAARPLFPGRPYELGWAGK